MLRFGLLLAIPVLLAAQEAPDLAVPANEHARIQLHATGGQIYGCQVKNGQYEWTLTAPDAELFDEHGRSAGKHFKGPTWRATDGSEVTGKMVKSQPSPDGAIPWLLLAAVSHSGQGMFSSIDFVQRIRTKGGKAPTSGCDSVHQGAEVRIPYEADYVFYGR